MNWSKYPFVRLLLSLVLGIFLYETVGGCALPPWGMGAALCAGLGIAFLLHRTMKSYRYRWIFGVWIILVYAFFGYVRASLQDPRSRDDYFGRLPTPNAIVARVFEPPLEKEKSVKVTLELVGFQYDKGIVRVAGKVMAYFPKEGPASMLSYGDLLCFEAPVEEVPPPRNPEEFDYRRFLERQGITGSVYLKDRAWRPLGVRRCNPVFAFAYRFRHSLLEALQRNEVTEEEFGVGAAILLGYDESLPPQLRQSYVAAGAMHILCVSGMHVGIVYLLASFVLKVLGHSKRMYRLRKLILIVLIWYYALLTGLSPSILRATLMLSFMAFGSLIHRKGFAVNSIAASAFILLLIDPNSLFAMGFQLSYLAVLGIVLLQKKIYNLLFFTDKVLDKAWEITSVSLAAQLATMPLTIYYFHQFSTYFWLSNLLLTPISFVVIMTGMLFLMLSWIPVLGPGTALAVRASLRLMNILVGWVEGMPLSIVRGLYINKVCLALCLLLLLLFWLFVNLKRKRMLMELLTAGAMLALCLALQTCRCARQRSLVVYSLRNHTALLLVEGFSSVMLCDASLLADPSAIDYSLKGHWSMAQLPLDPPCYVLDDDFSLRMAQKRRHLLSFQGELLAFWDPEGLGRGCRGPLSVDYLMVRGRQRPDLKQVVKYYRPGLLLIDGTVPRAFAEDWVRQAQALNMPCHNLRDSSYVQEYR